MSTVYHKHEPVQRSRRQDGRQYLEQDRASSPAPDDIAYAQNEQLQLDKGFSSKVDDVPLCRCCFVYYAASVFYLLYGTCT